MALQVASLFGVLGLQDNMSGGLETAKGNLTTFADRLDSLGTKLTQTGNAITTLAAPVAATFGVATMQALGFDEAMVNIQTITGKNADEMAALRQQIMSIGGSSRYGPQAAAEAFNDIVGGVADASTHMAIFEQAISTAQAGNADLGTTTRALIAVMNSYKLGAGDAALASDVLTQAVGMGVGSMDEVASAFPQVTGLAYSLGIGLDDLGAMMAYLTTQGNSFSQSGTQVSAMMAAMLNPNETMKAALNELGFSTGQAAIESLGLSGAYAALAGTQTASTDGMAKMLGSVEALRGATALAGPDVAGFMTTFTEGLTGATVAAESIQMAGAAAQVDLLKSSVSELSIEVGTALLPALTGIIRDVKPVIDQVIRWVKENPELIRQVGTIAAVALPAGLAISAAGTAISSVSTIVRAATTPMGALAAAIMAVVAAYEALQRFQSEVGAAQQNASNVHGAAISSGQISQKQYEDAAFNAAVAQFGDLGARLAWDNPHFRAILMAPYVANAPSHATGLDFVPHDNYMARLHEGEGILTASENRARQNGGGMGGWEINLNVTEGNAQNAGMNFAQGMREEMRRIGLVNA